MKPAKTDSSKRKLTGPRAHGSLDWTGAFLKSLEETGVIAKACAAVGISRVAVWERRKNDKGFLHDFEASLTAGALLLEEEAIRRARDGVRRIKFNPKTGEPYIDPDTKEPYVEHEYSDHLLLALLKRHFPQYREKPDEVHVAVNNITVSTEKLKELQERRRLQLENT